jgi:hypothetical protein
LNVADISEFMHMHVPHCEGILEGGVGAKLHALLTWVLYGEEGFWLLLSVGKNFPQK